jgi:hypothetical protein
MLIQKGQSIHLESPLDVQAIDDSEFIKTLFPTAYKSMYKEPEKIDEGPEGTENVDG